VIAVATIGLLLTVWRSPHQSELATYGAFAVPVLTAAITAGRMAWSLRHKVSADATVDEAAKLAILADRLAEVMKDQWTQEANRRGLLTPEPIPVMWRRPSLPLAGPTTAAVGSQRFSPLPGLQPIAETQLMTGHISDLHAVYGGLGSGRLIIAGEAGSGKSGAAVLLVLEALAHRRQVTDDERPEVPVLVLFTAHEWDPVNQPIQGWLMLQLQQAYPLFAGQQGALNAKAMITAGKISLILDGLDETDEALRPIALEALSREAAFRVVVLTRTAEMASSVSRRGVLEGAAAVELQSVDAATAADYLIRVQVNPLPDGWRQLIDHVRKMPESPLARAFNNPLTLTLVRDTYRMGDDIGELLKFRDGGQLGDCGSWLTESIVDHLLTRVVSAAYKRRPGERRPAYKLRTAQRAFENIALRMNKDRTRDLDLELIPRWTPAVPRCIMWGIIGGLDLGVLATVSARLIAGIRTAVNIGIAVGIVSAVLLSVNYWMVFIRTFERGHMIGRRLGRATFSVIDRSYWRQSIVSSLIFPGLPIVITSWIVFGIVFGLAGGLLRAFIVGLAVVGQGIISQLLIIWFNTRQTTTDDGGSLTPLTSWHSERKYDLTSGLLFALESVIVFGTLAVVILGWSNGAEVAIVMGVVAVSTTGLRLALSSFAFFQLAIRWHTPLRLIRFLDDARKRGILRRIGPLYQFRHARLQDRLALRGPSPPSSQ